MKTNFKRFQNFRCEQLAGATLLIAAGIMPSTALAQDIAEPPPPPGSEEAEAPPASIIVTGSRIVRDGNDAPTPVSVISSEEITTEAPANIADFVNTLPSVVGSQTAVSNSGSLSNGQSGISALNLRSLGQNRTLVLLDGQRSVGSTSTGLVDINTFPQALIERVEVVTGGASSVYGSDAVAGVVNFVLDRNFTGLEFNYEYGVTTYSDVPNHKVQVTAGNEFADGRGHLILAGEYFTQEGQHTIDRDWNETGFFQINNPAYSDTNGEPQRIVRGGIGSANFTPGGLITGGPFRGTYFGTIDNDTGLASVNQLNFGTVSGPWQIGGDYEYASSNHRGSNSLANDETRIGAFARASFEFSPAFQVFAQASYNQFKGLSFYQQTPTSGTTIQLDNAFLPQEFRDRVVAYNAANGTNISSISIGTSNAGIPAAGGDNKRTVQRYVVGANGEFIVGGLDLAWDAYYQHGRTDTNERLVNTWQNSRLAAQQDAVFDASGNIVCRVNIDANPANDLPGCVPINRIGVGGVTQDALNYLFSVLPSREQYVRQDVVAANVSIGELFETWDGPVSLAFGAEYREDSVDGYVNPINFETFLYGNYRVTSGNVNVKEAYAEALVPLGLGLEFNGAVRFTDYSVSGQVTTWKAGLTWEPIYDVRLRGTVSRDIRAPNLNELFDAGTARTNAIVYPTTSNVPAALRGTSDQFIQNLTGSTELTPEVAETYGAGIVITPSFLPGFAASADYFNISIEDAIDFVSAQTVVNLCFEQQQAQFCDNIRYEAGSTTNIEFIDLAPFNFAEQKASGIDFEASYRRPLGPGSIVLRGLATYYIENVTDNGIDAPNDSAGVNAGGGIPTFTYRATAGYDFDGGLSALFVGRGFGDGVYDNDYIECTTGCPTSGPVARTINENDIDGIFYLDANFTYDFDLGPVRAQTLFSVKNVFDRDPVLIGNGPDGNNTPAYPQTNRVLYDTLGRTFRLGLRVIY